MKSAPEDDSNVKLLINSLKDLGWSVRREKLTRGPSYRVKSGFCKLFGEKVVFVDRQLPVKQQEAFLEEFKTEITDVTVALPDGLSAGALPTPCLA
jgi:hypothetical protein